MATRRYFLENCVSYWIAKKWDAICELSWLMKHISFSAPSCDHFGRHGEWKKYLATKIFTKVANWRPTDYKRNLLGKLIDLWSNYQKQKRRYHLSFSFSPFRYSIRMRKPKLSENWEQAKLYFLYPAEEQNWLPSRPRQFSVETHQWTDDLPPRSTCWRRNPIQDWTLQDFQCVYKKNNFSWEHFCLILCISYKFWGTVLWEKSEDV